MIPDLLENMNSRIDDLIFEWECNQKNVPEGYFKCPYCKNIFDYSPISISDRPDSAICCYDCLPDDIKKCYDEFENSILKERLVCRCQPKLQA